MPGFVLRALLPVLLLAAVPAALRGQTPEATQARLREIQRQLDSDRDRLRRALEAEQVTVSTLDALDREVAARQALVATYGLRLDQVRAERDSLARTLGLLTNQFVGLRNRQAALVRQAYKHGRLNDLVLLFSARSVGEMVRRVQFLRRITALRSTHEARMQQSMQRLQARQADLARAERDATKTLGDATTEQRELAESQRRRAVVVDAMRGQRGDLEARIARNQEDLGALQSTLRSVAAAPSRRLSAPAETAAVAESGRAFEALRGQLPWPVPGVVTRGYGNYVSEVTGRTLQHPGLQIATPPGANVVAIFAGTVASVGEKPGFGTFVLVNHGLYQSAYANLSALAVRRGDTVQAGQIIARAGTDAQPLGAGLFFMLALRGSTTDPTPWLAPR